MKAEFVLNDVTFSHVVTSLENIARKVPDNARKTMRRAAERIVRQAKLYVPEDTGTLMNSIRLESSYGVRGRLQINVVAGGAGYATPKGRPLDQYAAIIHELYDELAPGPRTLEKMAANPGKVGARFLSRAAQEEEGAIQDHMIEAITQVIKSEGF